METGQDRQLHSLASAMRSAGTIISGNEVVSTSKNPSSTNKQDQARQCERKLSQSESHHFKRLRYHGDIPNISDGVSVSGSNNTIGGTTNNGRRQSLVQAISKANIRIAAPETSNASLLRQSRRAGADSGLPTRWERCFKEISIWVHALKSNTVVEMDNHGATAERNHQGPQPRMVSKIPAPARRTILLVGGSASVLPTADNGARWPTSSGWHFCIDSSASGQHGRWRCGYTGTGRFPDPPAMRATAITHAIPDPLVASHRQIPPG